MLYKIKFISEEVDGFYRELHIDSDATFLDLSNAILEACHYPDDEMTSFYICNDEWERGAQITREDVSDDSDESSDLYLMATTLLSEFIDDEGQRMEYIFDPFNERSFFLQVKDILPGAHLAAPEIVGQQGEAPQQIAVMESDVAPGAGKKGAVAGEEDFDDTLFYGSDDFDSEDFDPEGFEISDEGAF
jgi:hypothetical protein